MQHLDISGGEDVTQNPDVALIELLKLMGTEDNYRERFYKLTSLQRFQFVSHATRFLEKYGYKATKELIDTGNDKSPDLILIDIHQRQTLTSEHEYLIKEINLFAQNASRSKAYIERQLIYNALIIPIFYNYRPQTAKQACELVILLSNLGLYDRARMVLSVFTLKLHYPFTLIEIPDDLRHPFIESMVKIDDYTTNFSEKILEWSAWANCLKDKKLMKIELLDIIFSLKDATLKQKALWQTLNAESIFGSILYLKREWWASPAVEHKDGQLYRAAKELNEMLKGCNETVVTPQTEAALKKNADIKKQLMNIFPFVYQALCPLPKLDNTSHVRLFSLNDYEQISSAHSISRQPISGLGL